jgi:hypothetical protein
MTKPLKGGLLLSEKYKSLTGFAPVVKMLQSDSATINVLTTRSLKGFMFSLNVNPHDSTYQHFRFINGAKQITTFIIKIVVITDTVIKLPDFNGIPKSSETKISFLTEAELQQIVWIRNITGGKREFSPSVANFALFDRIQSFNLLKSLGTKGDRGTMDVIHYLSRIEPLSLGVLLMPMINNSVSLYTYAVTHQNDDDAQSIAYSNTIANIVKLFIIVNVIHWDLHSENAMIDETKESFLIDFGRASDIRKPKRAAYQSDFYLTVDEKEKLYLDAKSFKKTFEKMMGSVEIDTSRRSIKRRDAVIENSQKIEFMEEVCRFLTVVEHSKTQQKYRLPNKDHYQMYWMEQIYSSPDKDDIFLRAYEKLERDYLTNSVTISENTIDEYIRSGKLIDLSNDIDSYYYDFPSEVVLPSLNSLYKIPSAVVAPKNAFSSSIFEQRSTPGTYVDATPPPGTEETLVDPDEFSTQEDYYSSPPIRKTRIGGKTKKKNIKKRKTRKIRSK